MKRIAHALWWDLEHAFILLVVPLLVATWVRVCPCSVRTCFTFVAAPQVAAGSCAYALVAAPHIRDWPRLAAAFPANPAHTLASNASGFAVVVLLVPPASPTPAVPLARAGVASITGSASGLRSPFCGSNSGGCSSMCLPSHDSLTNSCLALPCGGVFFPLSSLSSA